jgi:hypothetical protein
MGNTTALPEPGNMTEPAKPPPANRSAETPAPGTTPVALVAAPASTNAASTGIRFDGNRKRMTVLAGAVGLFLMVV